MGRSQVALGRSAAAGPTTGRHREGQLTFGIDTVRSWVATYPYSWSNGGTILNKDKTRTTITEAATADAIQFRADLIAKHHVHPIPDELKAGGAALSMFIINRLAMESIWSPVP